MIASQRQAVGRAALDPVPLGLLAALTMAVGLVWLALAVDSATVPSIDLSITEEVQSVSFFAWDTLLGIGERLTGSPVGPAVWLVLIAVFWMAGRPVESLVLAASAAIWVPKAILEEIVARPRPPEEFLTISSTLDGFSFPSGHITAGVAVFGMLAIIAIMRLPGWRARSLVFLPVVLILALSALSRVADGAHWPSDVLGGFLLGGVWLLLMAWVYRSLRHDRVPIPGLRALKALRSKPAVPADGVRLAGSIASTVYLDDRAGTAVKVYRPSRPVRLLYWAAFQAPFPYSSREEALRAAAWIREFTGLLTRFWTGQDMVSAVLDIRCQDGEFHFVTELVSGEEPADNDEIMDELRTLRRHFARAGLPTWQIDPDNPHAHTNFIRTPDGQLKIIDLESTLIPLIQPLTKLPRLFRIGRLPTFDDVDFERLDGYVAANEGALRETLGVEEFARLERAIAQGHSCSDAWKSAEPNLWGRAGHRVWHWVDWDRRTGPIQRRLAKAEEYALEFITKPIDRRVAAGRMSETEAERLRDGLRSDGMRNAMRFLGMHVAVSFLPGPPGTRSLARFGLVLFFRYRASRQYATGDIDEEGLREAHDTHTWLVAFAALIPALGAGAYLLSPAMRRQGNLVPLFIDQTLYKVPFRLYERWPLHRVATMCFQLPFRRCGRCDKRVGADAAAARRLADEGVEVAPQRRVELTRADTARCADCP